jgi:hypothetical protein
MVTVLKFLILSRLEDFTISYTRLTSLKKKKSHLLLQQLSRVVEKTIHIYYFLLFTFHFSLPNVTLMKWTIRTCMETRLVLGLQNKQIQGQVRSPKVVFFSGSPPFGQIHFGLPIT